MAQEQTLEAELRTKTGSSECRRLRRRGLLPGTLYGHGQDAVSFTVPADALNSLVKSGSRVFDLQINGNTEKTMFRELQWNTWGTDVLHFDLLRIDAEERVTVEVSVELKGVAPGVVAGGNVDFHLRSLSLECPAIQLPDSIPVRIGALEIGDMIHVSDLEFPEGFTIHSPPESVVVQILAPREEEDEDLEEAEPGPAEPEVIGRKEETEESE